MASFIISFDLIATFLIAAGLLFYYGNWYHHSIPVTLLSLMSWYFSFIIILILPLDISSTIFHQCLHLHGNETGTNDTTLVANHTCVPPSSYTSPHFLPSLWTFVYWTTLLLTYVLLPFLSSYINSGEFTTKRKLRSALVDNLVYFSIYLFICAILLIYLVAKAGISLDWDKLKAVAASAGNSWGLFLLVLLLGRSLILIPLSLYSSSNSHHSLTHAYFKLSKLSQERNSSEEQVEDVMDTLVTFQGSNSFRNRYSKELSTIENQIPLEIRERFSRRRRGNSEDSEIPKDYSSLVKLHKNVKKALQNYHRCECQWGDMVGKAVLLEDVVLAKNSGTFVHSFPENRNLVFDFLGNDVEKVTRTLIMPVGTKILAFVAAFFSFLVIWSETTFSIENPTLTLFAIFLQSTKESYWVLEFGATVIIGYMSLCAFHTIFKIRVFNFYYLSGKHQTDEASLVFSAMLLSRITPPLSLNVISLFHLDSHVVKGKGLEETAYTRVMGHMDVLSLISDYFNIYFPLGILIVALATYFRIGDRLLNFLGFEQFGIDDKDNDNDDSLTWRELVSEGKELVQREKRRRMGSSASRETRRRGRDIVREPEESGSYHGDFQPREQQGPPRGLFDDV